MKKIKINDNTGKKAIIAVTIILLIIILAILISVITIKYKVSKEVSTIIQDKNTLTEEK